MLRDRFVECVRLSAQDPLGATIKFHEEIGRRYAADAGNAYVFSVFAHGGDDMRPDVRRALFRLDPYSSDETTHFHELDPRAKAHVLGFETFFLHELIHQVDCLLSPHGAFLLAHQAEEYLVLRKVFLALRSAQSLDLRSPLARALGSTDGEVCRFLDGLGLLEELRLVLETSRVRILDGIPLHAVKEGWLGEPTSVELCGRQYSAITLYDGFHTINIDPAAQHTHPLTIRTLLEARAVTNCLRHILWRFRSDPSTAASEMARYLLVYYPDSPVDYRFVIDVLSRCYGFERYEDVLLELAHRESSIEAFDQLLAIATTTSWVALHGPDAAERLIASLKLLPRCIAEDGPFSDPSELATALGTRLELDPAAMLQSALNIADRTERRLMSCSGNTADHFRHLLQTVRQELRKRLEEGNGLVHPVGTPNYGNPSNWLHTVVNPETFGGLYEPNDAYDAWRIARSAILTRCRPTSGEKLRLLDNWLQHDSTRGAGPSVRTRCTR